MKENFSPSFTMLMASEGGYVNNPNDAGGPTNLGVTLNAWSSYVKRAVSIAEIQALTPAAVQPFYRTEYWDRVHGDDLPNGVDYTVFDCAVNSGVGLAIVILQDVVGVTQDAEIGPETMAAVRRKPASEVIAAFCSDRLDHLGRSPKWPYFKDGWTRRVERVKTQALAMATN